MSQPSKEPSPAVLGAIAVGALVLGLVVFWSRPAPNASEWTPADHDQPASMGNQAGPGRSATPPARQKPTPADDAAGLTELAWSRSCVSCHGERGRGDGPQGAMLRAPDLTRADWQGRVTDDDIRKTILNGRNNMPKFDLPAGVVDGLVKRIRANRAP